MNRFFILSTCKLNNQFLFLPYLKFERSFSSSTKNHTTPTSEQILSPKDYAKSLVSVRKSCYLNVSILPFSFQTKSTPTTRPDERNDKDSLVYGALVPYILYDKHLSGLSSSSQEVLYPYIPLRQEEKITQALEESNLVSFTVYSLLPKQLNPSQVQVPVVNIVGSLDLIARSERVINSHNQTQSRKESSGCCSKDNEIPEPLMELERKLYGELKKQFTKAHPGSVEYLDDFSFYRLNIDYLSLSNYDSSSKPIFMTSQDFETASIDPLLYSFSHSSYSRSKSPLSEFSESPSSREFSPSVVFDRLNQPDYQANFSLMCELYGGVPVWPFKTFVYHVDRFGINVIAKELSGRNEVGESKWVGLRFPFPFEIKTEYELFNALHSAFESLPKK